MSKHTVNSICAAAMSVMLFIAGITASACFTNISANPLILNVSAASVRKCYTITSGYTPVYQYTNLTSKIGTIFPTDELVVNNVTSSYVDVTYSVSNGTKRGYIHPSAILLDVNGVATKTSSGKITTYIRNTTNSTVYGYVAKGDNCLILGTSNNMVQLKYPTSFGFKYAFVTASDAATYLGYSASGSTSTTVPNNSIISYSQYDSRWKNYSYGYSNAQKTARATIGSSGCGLLSLTNIAANLSGKFINPTIIADYSVKYGYRVNGVGTAYGLYKSFCNNRGSQYGIQYTGYTSSWNTLQSYLKDGKHAAVVHVPNHIMALVGYNSSTGKYLLVDSSPSSKRGTSSGYAWKTKAELKNISVYDDFYIIGRL